MCKTEQNSEGDGEGRAPDDSGASVEATSPENSRTDIL